MHLYVLFPSAHEAMKLDRLLTKEAVAHELVPIPRRLGSSCGVAMRVLPKDGARVAALAERGGVRTEGYHQLEEN